MSMAKSNEANPPTPPKVRAHVLRKAFRAELLPVASSIQTECTDGKNPAELSTDLAARIKTSPVAGQRRVIRIPVADSRFGADLLK